MAGQEVRGMLIRLEATTAQLRQEMDRADASVTKATGRIDSQLSKVDSAFDRAAKSAQSAGNVLKGALALAIGGASVGAIIDQAEAYTTVANRLKLVTSSSKEFTDAQNAVFSIAQKSGQPLTATAELYQRIATNQKELKLTGQGVAGIVETISKTMVISGASTESANAALIQLGQAFASGTLRGEELNSVLEQAPALAQAIAQGMGKTVGELRTLGANGKLTAAAVVAALQAQSGAVDALFDKMQSTIGTALTRIHTSFTRIIGEADKFSGASVSLAGAINQASRALDQIHVPEALAVLSEHADSLSTILNTVLYAALGKAAAGLVGWTAKSGAALVANQQLLAASAKSAQQDLWAAQSKQIDARALVTRQELELKAAQGKVASDRARQESELANIRSVQAALVAEMALEQQRLKAQISETGRNASLARMVEIRGSQIAITKQVEAAERSLGATTVATSAQIQAANEQVTASKVALGETTLAVKAATIAAKESAASATFAARAWGGLKTGASGLLGLLGGPVGLAFMAGAVALSFVDFSDKSKTLMGDLGDLGKSVDQVRTEFNKLNEDQQRAQINTWKDKQLGATLAVENAYKALKESVQSALVEPPNPDVVDPAKIASQVRAFEDLSAKLDAARASGQALGPILRDAAAKGQISPEQLRQWETLAGAFSDNAAVAAQVKTRLDELTGALNQNTTATNANNQAKAGFTTEGEKYLDTIQKQLAGLKDGGDAIKEANRYIAEHTNLSESDRLAILSTANAIESQKAATKAAKDETKLGNAAAREAATELKNQQKALEEFTAKSAISTKAANDLADAYLAGIDNIREITLQQKVEEELLKTGAGARDKVTEAIRNQMAAEDRRDVAKNIADLRLEAQQTLAQATATLQGADALEAFNLQKSMQLALLGKGIEYGSKEYDQLLATTKAQLDHNKALEQAGQANSIVDRLYPQTKLLRDYTNDQEALNRAIELYPEKADAYRDALQRLGIEYEQNQRAATAWGQFTEGAVDRIDGAFADMWKSILSKSGNFMDTLKDSFRQFLAELLHMAITKPIIVQFASSLGIGGAAVQSAGLFGDPSGGGGNGITSLLGNISNTISVAGSKFGQAVMSGWNGGEGLAGGLEGAFNNGADYFKGAVESAFASGTAAAATTASQLATNLSAQGFSSLSVQAGNVVGTNTGLYLAGAGGGLTSSAGAAAQFGAEAGLNSAATTTAASSALASLSIALSYIQGVYTIFTSFQQYGLKGAAVTGGMAAAGAAIGTYIMPGIGTAVGFAAGAVLGALGAGKLFSSGEKYPDLSTSGQGTFENGSYTSGGIVQGWQTKAPKYGAAADAQMDSTINQFTSTLGMLYNVLGDGSKVFAYDMMQVRKTSGRYSTTFGATIDGGSLNDLNIHQQFDAADAAEALKHNYDDVMGTFLAKAIVSSKSLPDYFKAQFTDFANSWDTTADEVIKAIEGVFTRFNGVNAALERINVNSLKMGENGLMASDNILNIVASMSKLDTATASAQDKVDALNKVVNDYYSSFFTQQEQFDDLKKSLTGAFAGFGLNLPDSRPAFRALVEGIDVTTAAGQAMFATLMGLASSASTYYTGLEQNAKDAQAAADEAAQKITDGLMKGATDAFNALQRSVNAQKASINDMLSTASARVTDLTGVSSSLDSALKALRGTSDDAVRMLRSQAQATLQSALAISRAGGSLAGFEGLTDALDTISSNNTDLYSSLDDFNRDQGRTANVVAELNTINGKQLSSAEQTVKTLQDQLTALDDQLVFAQAQLDALNGVDNSVIAVKDAITAMNAAVLAVLASKPATGAGSAMANTSGNNSTLLETVYQSVLGRDVDAAGAAYWGALLQSGGVSYKDLAAAVARDATSNGELRGHAAGGYVSGPGTGTSDSIIRKLSNGEYVLRAAAVRAFGTDALNQMNSLQIPAFAAGGPVLDISSPSQVFAGRNATTGSGSPTSDAATVEELRGLRAEMQANFEFISKYIKETADNTDEMVNRGLAIVGVVETKVATA